MKLTEMKVNDFIDLLASDAPAPGGGSASALAGAMGVGVQDGGRADHRQGKICRA